MAQLPERIILDRADQFRQRRDRPREEVLFYFSALHSPGLQDAQVVGDRAMIAAGAVLNRKPAVQSSTIKSLSQQSIATQTTITFQTPLDLARTPVA
jgi:hypothetical protein